MTRCGRRLARLARLGRGVLLCACTRAPAGLAQAPDTTARHGPVLARTDAAILGVAAVASTVMIGWDAAIAKGVRQSSLQDHAVVRDLMNGGRVFGDPGTIVLGAGLWLSGRLAHDETREKVGLRALEAIAVTGVATSVLKGLAGRARPDTSPTNARDFVLGRGIGTRDAFQSFPSGHATAAWAFASAVDAEWSRLSPGHARWVPDVLYAIATLTSASRVVQNRHWTSDVVFGSAIGFVGGRAVVRWHADRP